MFTHLSSTKSKFLLGNFQQKFQEHHTYLLPTLRQHVRSCNTCTKLNIALPFPPLRNFKKLVDRDKTHQEVPITPLIRGFNIGTQHIISPFRI